MYTVQFIDGYVKNNPTHSMLIKIVHFQLFTDSEVAAVNIWTV